MNEVQGTIARWLEQKRRRDRASAAVICVLALGTGATVFLLTAFLIYTVLSIIYGVFVYSVMWLWLVALGLTAGFFAHTMKRRQEEPDLHLDPMGLWIIKDIFSVGPRLLLEGLRQLRLSGQLAELNVATCARALAYLAGHNAAVNWEDLIGHCRHVPSERLRGQLFLLEGVLFLGENASRVSLMEPFRMRLRWMLGRDPSAGKEQEPTRPRSEVPPAATPVNEPEKLSAYELLGLSPLASLMEIKRAYRKRLKECHPDLFAGMDQPAKALAERWTKALNAAYATLNPRHPGARPASGRQR